METKPTIEEFRKMSKEDKRQALFSNPILKNDITLLEKIELVKDFQYDNVFSVDELLDLLQYEPGLINNIHAQNRQDILNENPKYVGYLSQEDQMRYAGDPKFLPYIRPELAIESGVLNNHSYETLYEYAKQYPQIIEHLPYRLKGRYNLGNLSVRGEIRGALVDEFLDKSPERLLELDDIPPIPYDKLLDILKEHPEKAKYLEKQSNDSLVMKGLFSACYLEEYKSTYKRILPYLSVDAQKLLININNNLYNSASENVKADDDFRYKLVKSDFRNAKLLSAEEREQPEFASCVERMHTLEDFSEGRIKLDDIDKNMFADIKFYNSIVKTAKDKIIERFNEVTKDANLTDKVETKLEEKMLTKIKKLEKKLSMQRKLTMLKNGIMEKLNISKSNHDLMKQVDGIEV